LGRSNGTARNGTTRNATGPVDICYKDRMPSTALDTIQTPKTITNRWNILQRLTNHLNIMAVMSIIDRMPDVRVDMLAYLSLFVILTLAVRSYLTPKPSAPLLNPKRWYEFTSSRAVTEVLHTTRSILEDWFAKNPTKPMRLTCDLGDITFLPPSMADEIKRDPRLSFIKAANDSVCGSW
jgi:hypothetical protein